MPPVTMPPPTVQHSEPDDDPIAARNLNSLSAAYETASALTASNPPLVGNGAVSVVPDLMQVYENMTKSSTPQDGIGASSSHSHDAATAATNTQQYSLAKPYYYGHQDQPTEQLSWMQTDNAELVVPPIPKAAMAVLSEPAPRPTRCTSQASSLSHTSSSQAPTVRRNNKRSQAATTAATTCDGDASSAPDDSESDDAAATSKKRRKAKNDGRWSKRFTWPEDLHRDFCSAIFDVGLKHASPTQVMEFMPKHPDITSERIKSHLQKYRIHRTKSKQDFMTSFDVTLQRLKQHGVDPSMKSLAGGEVAAYLTFSEFAEPGSLVSVSKGADKEASSLELVEASTADQKLAPPPAPQLQGCLVLPRLSEVEKNSPLGMSLGYLMGLFFSLKQQLMTQRALQSGQMHMLPPAPLSQPGMAALEAFVKPGTTLTTGSMSHFDNLKVKGLASLPEGVTATQRSNLEESTLMKREMDNQMAFQNKMRALKQQELDKYRTTSAGSDEAAAASRTVDYHPNSDDRAGQPLHQPPLYHPPIAQQNHHHHPPLPPPVDDYHHPHQSDSHMDDPGAGEFDSDARARGISLGNEDFWNVDMMDDQLFEFLMNN